MPCYMEVPGGLNQHFKPLFTDLRRLSMKLDSIKNLGRPRIEPRGAGLIAQALPASPPAPHHCVIVFWAGYCSHTNSTYLFGIDKLN